MERFEESNNFKEIQTILNVPEFVVVVVTIAEVLGCLQNLGSSPVNFNISHRLPQKII